MKGLENRHENTTHNDIRRAEERSTEEKSERNATTNLDERGGAP